MGRIVNIDTSYFDRRRFIGGSDARIIMGKDEKALLRLWREKRGEAAALDLSGVLIVQLGIVTEDLNRRWYELNTGAGSLTSSGTRSSGLSLDGCHARWAGRKPALFSRPSSCYPSRSRRRRLPRSTWPNSSTTCWSRAPRNGCFPSLTLQVG